MSTKDRVSSKFAAFVSKSMDEFEEDEEYEEIEEKVESGLPAGEAFELELPSIVYDDFVANNEVSTSPRDKLSFVDDKKKLKEVDKFLTNNGSLLKLTRILQTEIIRCKPDNILDFINDEFFSLANQTRLRNILPN